MQQEQKKITTMCFREQEEPTGNPYEDTLPYSSYIKRIDVAHFGEYQLRVYFRNGTVYEYDVRPLIRNQVFKDYKQVFDVMSGIWQQRTGSHHLSPGTVFQRYIKKDCPSRRVES